MLIDYWTGFGLRFGHWNLDWNQQKFRDIKMTT